MRRSAMSITAIAITNGNRTTTATMCAVMTAYPIHGVDAVQENECRKHHGRHASDAHRLIRHSGGSIGPAFLLCADVGHVECRLGLQQSRYDDGGQNSRKGRIEMKGNMNALRNAALGIEIGRAHV